MKRTVKQTISSPFTDTIESLYNEIYYSIRNLLEINDIKSREKAIIYKDIAFWNDKSFTLGVSTITAENKGIIYYDIRLLFPDLKEINGLLETVMKTVKEGVPTVKEFFPLTSVSREDFESRGYDASSVPDTQMETMAKKVTDSIMEDYWLAIDAVADHFELPKKEDES